MQGSILYVDEKQGFLQGADQNRYYFTHSDWRGSGNPAMGQNVSFTPDGQNARDVEFRETAQAGWGAPSAIPPPPVGGFSNAHVTAGQYSNSKNVHNIPLAIGGALLLISLMLPYGKLIMDFRLTDTGLRGFYFAIPLALTVVAALGLPKLWPWLIWAGAVLATFASIMDRESLFTQISAAKGLVGQVSGLTGGFVNEEMQQRIQGAMPSIMDNLAFGFYFHILSLIAVGSILLFFKYEVRGNVMAIAMPGNIDTAQFAQAGRSMLAGAERLTGQSVPTSAEAGNFMKGFLTFDRMIAPVIIMILYYINLVLIVLTGLGIVLFGVSVGEFKMVLIGLVVLVLGPLWARVVAEFLIVIFKIHERLKDIAEKEKL